MSFIEKIKSFFKKIFNKENVKQLDAPKIIEPESEESSVDDLKEKKENFINSIKVNIVKMTRKEKRVETPECAGDGLGFKNEIKY